MNDAGGGDDGASDGGCEWVVVVRVMGGGGGGDGGDGRVGDMGDGGRMNGGWWVNDGERWVVVAGGGGGERARWVWVVV